MYTITLLTNIDPKERYQSVIKSATLEYSLLNTSSCEPSAPSKSTFLKFGHMQSCLPATNILFLQTFFSTDQGLSCIGVSSVNDHEFALKVCCCT